MNSIPWIIESHSDENIKLRLFCFPFAGGVSSYFNSWRSKVPKGVDICPVMLPGREKLIRQNPYTDIYQLCDVLVEKIEAITEVPYVFFGHSMGALIAYQLAQALVKKDRPLPLHLFLSGFPAPGYISKRRPMHDLDDNEFKLALSAFNATPREVLDNSALMAVILPYLRADFKMIETYRCQDALPLPIPISVYGGNQDHISRSDLLKWKFETTLSFQLHMFDGGHFYLNDSEAMNEIMNRELLRLITQVSHVQYSI